MADAARSRRETAVDPSNVVALPLRFDVAGVRLPAGGGPCVRFRRATSSKAIAASEATTGRSHLKAVD